MLRVTVVDATGAEHRFTVAGRNEDYEVHEDPTTGELVVEHVTYDRRGASARARTGSQVVGAWPAGTWQRACLHGPAQPHAGPVEQPVEPPDEPPEPAELPEGQTEPAEEPDAPRPS